MSVFEVNNKINAALNSTVERWVIYLRKSRADIQAEKHGDGDTLERHRAILTELAAKRGLYVVEIIEEVVSGDTIAARPGIQRLIQNAYKGEYTGIICMAADRLSRGNQGDAQKIIDMLKFGNQNNGLLVITPTRQYDVAHNSDDEEFIEFELFMSRREYKLITRRLKYGKDRSVVEGNYMAPFRPYGYEIVRYGKVRTLKAIPEEAEWVKKMYEWVVKDKWSANKIAKHLTMLGVPTMNGATDWDRETVRCILINPVYYGMVRWRTKMVVQTMVDNKIVKVRQDARKTDKYMLYKGKHDGLVDEETFMIANEKYNKPRVRSQHALKNPFAGLIFCGKCGRAVRMDTTKASPGAKNRYTHQPNHTCKIKSVVADDMWDAIIHGLQQYIDDFEMMLDDQPEVDQDSVMEQIAMLEKQIKTIKGKINVLFDMAEEQQITPNEFAERKHIHYQRIEEINAEIERLQNEIPEPVDYQEMIFTFHAAIDLIRDPEIDAEIKNEFLKTFIDRIVLSRENNEEFILDIFLK